MSPSRQSTTAVSVVNPPLGFALTIVGAGTSILLDNMLGPETPAIRTWAGRANAVAGTAGDIAEEGSKLTTKSMAQGFGKLGAATLVIGGIFDGMEISDAYDIRDDLTTRLQKIQALYRSVSGKLQVNLAICNEYEDAINRLKAAFKAKKVEYKELSLRVEQHAGATETATGDDIDERFETQDIDDEAFGVEDESGD